MLLTRPKCDTCLVVAHDIGVLQPAQCCHLPQDAAVAAAAATRLQTDLLDCILAPIKPAVVITTAQQHIRWTPNVKLQHAPLPCACAW